MHKQSPAKMSTFDSKSPRSRDRPSSTNIKHHQHTSIPSELHPAHFPKHPKFKLRQKPPSRTTQNTTTAMPTFQVPEDDSSLLSDTGSGMDIEGDSFIAQVNKINRTKTEEESKTKDDPWNIAKLAEYWYAKPKPRNREEEQPQARATRPINRFGLSKYDKSGRTPLASLVNPLPRKNDRKLKYQPNSFNTKNYAYNTNTSILAPKSPKVNKNSYFHTSLFAPKSPKATANPYLAPVAHKPSLSDWKLSRTSRGATLTFTPRKKPDFTPKWPKERGTPPLFKQSERVAQPGRVTPERAEQPERDIPMLNTDLPSSTGKRKRDEYEPQPPARDTYSISASDIEQDTPAPAVRRIGGMIVTIISCAAMLVARILKYLRDQIGQDEEVLAVETDSSGRKRRAVPSTSLSSASKKTRKISPATKKVRKVSPTPGAFPSPIAAGNSPVVPAPAAQTGSKILSTEEESHKVESAPAGASPAAIAAENSQTVRSPAAPTMNELSATTEEPSKAESSAPGPPSGLCAAEQSQAAPGLAPPVASTIPAAKKERRAASQAVKAMPSYARAEKNRKDEKVDGLVTRSKASLKSGRVAREEGRRSVRSQRDEEAKRKEEESREWMKNLVRSHQEQQKLDDAETWAAAYKAEPKRWGPLIEQRKRAEEAEAAERAAEELARQKAIEDELARKAAEEAERIAAEELAKQKAIEDELARLAVEEEKKAKAEGEERVKAEEAAKLKLKAEEEARVKAEQEKAKAEAEEAARKAEEERLANDPVARAEAEEKARKDEEERLAAEAAAQADHERKQILIRPLDPAWDDRVKEAMATKRDTVLATSPEGVSLSRRDFGTLLPQEGTSDDSSGWLNDEIINAMFQSIVMRKAEQTQRSKHHGGTVPVYESYNSSWWQTANSKKGVQGLDRWGRRKNISGDKLLQCEKVFMPINTGAHWTLIIVSPQEKTIEHLDSMNGKGINALKQTRAWLQMELGALYHPDEWTEKRGLSGKQANSDDCGVFTIMNGLAAAKQYPYSAVKSADMPLARRTIAAILLNKGFDGDWDL